MIVKSFTTPRDVQILKLAVPSIISNITVPLLGLVDVAIVGHIGDASYIGAVAVGTMLFNLFYWVFAFLRMGTSGMTSQALGRRDLPEVARLMVRALLIGLGIGASLIALQTVVFRVGFWLMGPTEEVLPLCLRYCEICVWGAPAVMGLYGLTGWFIGMQNTKIPMWVSIAQNVVNITMSLLLVFVFGLDIEGVALGTLIAQWSGFLVSLWFWIRIYAPRLRHYSFRAGLWEKGVLARFFRVNGDIFLRTLCIAGVNFCFTSAGARQGTLMLAVNTLLMTLFTIFSYFMDGFAFAGEALSGRYYGSANREALLDTITRLFRWGAVMVVGFTLLYAVGGEAFLSLLTSDNRVVEAAGDYFWWALAVPLAGVGAFVLDGVFIGITDSRSMLLSAVVGALLFFGLYALLSPVLGNHALWLSFIIYLGLRSLTLGIIFRHKLHNAL